jgi:hypothetical protein
MSNPHLPEELLDLIVDLLHDTRDALKSCCLISKSWIPRTRKHLFAHIRFYTTTNLQSWKNMFSDPSTSPARYTQTLSIDCVQDVTATDAEEGGWIPTFSCVRHFKMTIHKTGIDKPVVSLLSFHGFSPVIKSLCIIYTCFPLSCIFDLIRSFPLLEDLSVETHDTCDSHGGLNGSLTAVRPLTPPVFTGSLDLILRMGMDPIATRLLSLSVHLHFRKLNLTWNRENDVSLTTALVESCGSTLESLHIYCRIGTSV